MLSKYQEYIIENLASRIDESIVYFSPKLRQSLHRINSDISNDLLGLEEKDIADDMTFLDLTDQQGYISFTTVKNARTNLEINYSPAANWGHVHGILTNPNRGMSDALYGVNNQIWKNSRNPLKIGRFINKVFPKKYTDKEIEDFTNKFKSILEAPTEKMEMNQS